MKLFPGLGSIIIKTKPMKKEIVGFFVTLLLLFSISVYAQQGISNAKKHQLSLTLDSTFCSSQSMHDSIAELGLYGGIMSDLCISPINSRIFSGMSFNPLSLFYSDDSCKSWKSAFPIDSLESLCEKRIWGISAKYVHVNKKGWVAALTNIDGGNRSCSVISFLNGDSGTFHTAMDQYLFAQYNTDSRKVTAIGLSDYYLYTCLGKYMVKIDTSVFNYSTDVLDITTKITGINDSSSIISIALANDSSGYPFYSLIDTAGQWYNKSVMGNILLYKYDGASFFEVTMPSILDRPTSVFVHPYHTDTLFITGYSSSTKKIYRSYDGGVSWTDISYDGLLTDLEFSPNWNIPTQLVLISNGKSLSKDFGDTWESTTTPYGLDALCLHPYNENIYVGATRLGCAISYNGFLDTFSLQENVKLEAIQISKIARNADKTIFYVATQSGLAYTTAYKDTTISAYDKWHSPYGEYPVSSISPYGDMPIFSVAIDPNDSLHVIAGGYNYLFVTHNGNSYFDTLILPGFTVVDKFTDIAFLNSKTIIAVSSADSSSIGHICLSQDGGLSWAIVSPSGFCCGNSIAIAATATDTVIYIGTGTNQKYNGALYASYDKGLSWQFINNGPHSSTDSTITSLPIWDIAVVPHSKDSFYIASGSNLDCAFIYSKDGGQNYENMSMKGKGGAFSSVIINEKKPDSSVYVSIEREIYNYNPSIDSMSLVYKGYPGEKINDLHYGSILMATTSGFYGILYDTTDDIPTDIKEENNLSLAAFDVFPNPTNGFISIRLPQPLTTVVEIYDIAGKKVISESFSNEVELVINGESLANGIYLLKLTDNEKNILSRLIVKE